MVLYLEYKNQWNWWFPMSCGLSKKYSKSLVNFSLESMGFGDALFFATRFCGSIDIVILRWAMGLAIHG